MVEAYGYKQQIINELNNIDNDTNNFYNYKDLNFLSKFSCKNKNLVIIFHGSIPGSGTNRIYFRGHDWEIKDTDIVCISDYLFGKYDKCRINWYLSTEKYNAEHIYEELFTYLINVKNYNKVVFTGTSGGGFPSVKFACRFNSIALVSNSQFYLEEYGKSKTYDGWIDFLKNIANNNNDKLIYKNKQIEMIINNYKPKQVIIYNNMKDSTYNLHLLPLIKCINNNKLSNLFEINLFDFDGYISPGKTHHSIIFPNDKKHIDILSKFINKLIIPIGNDCMSAGNLKKLNLRKQSFPFDYLLINPRRVFEYVNDLINTRFEYFTQNLIYNKNNFVISENYDYVEFRHHDLIKKNELIETMKKRGKRFLDIIDNQDNEVCFLVKLYHKFVDNINLYNDMKTFNDNKNIKCNWKVLVYIYNDNDDFEFSLPENFKNLNKFIFYKFIRNQKNDKVYGDVNDFKKMLQDNNLI